MNDESRRRPEAEAGAEEVGADSVSAESTLQSTSAKDVKDTGSDLPESSGHVGNETDDAVLAASRRRTRRSFVAAGIAAAAGYGFYHWLGTEPSNMDVPALLRHGYNFDADVAKDLFRDHALAPTYPVARAETLRVNGVYGLKMALQPASYRLQLVGAKNAEQHAAYVPDVTAWQYEYDAAAGTGDQLPLVTLSMQVNS